MCPLKPVQIYIVQDFRKSNAYVVNVISAHEQHVLMLICSAVTMKRLTVVKETEVKSVATAASNRLYSPQTHFLITGESIKAQNRPRFIVRFSRDKVRRSQLLDLST